MQGEVITFYSYTGGTGRSTAAANVATLLARGEGAGLPAGDGDPVLMIDWALEAPALHRFFALDDRESDAHPGLIDLFTAIDARLGDRPVAESEAQAIFDAVKPEEYILPAVQPHLFLLKAGRFDQNYCPQVSTFPWERLERRAPWLFQALLDRWREQYRYIVIDSRSGVSDMSGICTMMLPDTLVALFTANRASIEGASDVGRLAAEYRTSGAPLRVFPVPSRIEFTEGRLRHHWRAVPGGLGGFQPEFETLLSEIAASDVELGPYFSEVQIPYVPRYAFGEHVAVLIEGGNHPSAVYRAFSALAGRIAAGRQAWQADPGIPGGLELVRARLEAERAELTAAGELDRALRAIQQLSDIDAAAGQLEDARQLCRDAVIMAREIVTNHGGDMRVLAQALDRAGRLDAQAADWMSASSHLGEAAEHYREAEEDWKRASALEVLAGVSVKLGNDTAATRHLNEALDVYRAEGDPLGIAFVHQALGDLARTVTGGAPEPHYLQAIEIFRDEREVSGLASCLRSLAEVHRKRNRLDEARRHFTQAAELTRGQADVVGLTASLAGLADVERRLRHHDEATACFSEAVALARQSGQVSVLAAALQGFADMNSRLGKLTDAQAQFTEAIELYKNAANRLGMANTTRSLGDLERRLGRRPEARARYEQAMELYQMENHSLGQANCLQSLGDLAKMEERWEEAQARYQHAIQMFKRANAPLGLANALKSLGDVEGERTNSSLSAIHYHEAIELYRLERNGLGQANALQGLGDLHRKQQRYKQALDAYVQARELYRAENAPMGLAYTCAELARVCHATFDFGGSIRYITEASTAAEASGVPSVSQYVWGVDREIRGTAIPA